MSKPWISDKAQRRSVRYQKIHAQLVKEVREGHKPPSPDKQTRKMARAELFRLASPE
jgi:hypothetical protein